LSSLPEATRRSVLNRYRSEERDVLALAEGREPAEAPRATDGRTRLAQADAGTVTDAGDRPRMGGFTFSDSPPYPELSVSERQTLLRTMRTRFRASTLPMLRSGLERILNGEEPERDRSGRTALDIARTVMTPLQFDSWNERWTRALEHRSATMPLYHMRSDEITEHAVNLRPSVRPAASRIADRILELRTTDSARAVSGGDLRGTERRPPVSIDPATGVPSVINLTGNEDIRLPAHRHVAAAYDMIRQLHPDVALSVDRDGNVSFEAAEGADADRAQDVWRILIDGRLAAQRELGVPERHQAPITRTEAESLLAMPRRMTDEEFGNHLRSAVDRAYQRYGPYARMVLETAFRFRANLNREQQFAVEGALHRMIEGTGYSEDDFRRIRDLEALDREERAWMGGDVLGYESGLGRVPTFAPGEDLAGATGFGMMPMLPAPAAPPPERTWWGGSRPAAGPLGPADPETLRAPVHRPPPEEIDYLRQHPEIWQEFDMDYGAGAAAMYLGVEPEARTGR
jgi:hypothetical protein